MKLFCTRFVIAAQVVICLHLSCLAAINAAVDDYIVASACIAGATISAFGLVRTWEERNGS